MVAVVATRELKAGEFLLRFKTEASQDNTHGSRPINARPVFGNYGILLTCMSFFSPLLFFSLVHVCVCMCVCVCVCVCVIICAVFLLMFAILYKITTHARG